MMNPFQLLRRPKISFVEWMKFRQTEDYYHDIANIMGVTYLALKKTTPLTFREKRDILNAALVKLDKRIMWDQGENGPKRWDARSNKWFNSVMRRAEAAIKKAGKRGRGKR